MQDAIFKQGKSYWKNGRQLCKRTFFRIIDTVTGETERIKGDAISRSLHQAISNARLDGRCIVEEFEAWCDADIDDKLRPVEKTEQAELISEPSVPFRP